jgi:Flp pilus assembly protein TadG
MRTCRNSRRRGTRRRGGHGVMEAALVLPVLLALSMGMVEFGTFFQAKHTITGAARDGCRTAILGGATHAQAVAAVDNTMNSAGYAQGTYTVGFSDPDSSAAIADVALVERGRGVRVTVRANFGDIGTRPLGVLPADKAVTGITTMIKE